MQNVFPAVHFEQVVLVHGEQHTLSDININQILPKYLTLDKTMMQLPHLQEAQRTRKFENVSQVPSSLFVTFLVISASPTNRRGYKSN